MSNNNNSNNNNSGQHTIASGAGRGLRLDIHQTNPPTTGSNGSGSSDFLSMARAMRGFREKARSSSQGRDLERENDPESLAVGVGTSSGQKPSPKQFAASPIHSNRVPSPSPRAVPMSPNISCERAHSSLTALVGRQVPHHHIAPPPQHPSPASRKLPIRQPKNTKPSPKGAVSVFRSPQNDGKTPLELMRELHRVQNDKPEATTEKDITEQHESQTVITRTYPTKDRTAGNTPIVIMRELEAMRSPAKTQYVDPIITPVHVHAIKTPRCKNNMREVEPTNPVQKQDVDPIISSVHPIKGPRCKNNSSKTPLELMRALQSLTSSDDGTVPSQIVISPRQFNVTGGSAFAREAARQESSAPSAAATAADKEETRRIVNGVRRLNSAVFSAQAASNKKKNTKHKDSSKEKDHQSDKIPFSHLKDFQAKIQHREEQEQPSRTKEKSPPRHDRRVDVSDEEECMSDSQLYVPSPSPKTSATPKRRPKILRHEDDVGGGGRDAEKEILKLKLKEMSKKHEQYIDKISSLKRDLSCAQKETEKARQDAAEIEERMSSISQQNENYKSQMSQLREELALAHDKSREMQEMNVAREDDGLRLTKLDEEMRAANLQIEVMTLEEEELKRKVVSLEEDLSRAYSSARQDKDKLVSMQKELHAMTAEKLEDKEKLETQTRIIRDLKKRIDSIRGEYASELENLRSETKTSSETIDSLRMEHIEEIRNVQSRLEKEKELILVCFRSFCSNVTILGSALFVLIFLPRIFAARWLVPDMLWYPTVFGCAHLAFGWLVSEYPHSCSPINGESATPASKVENAVQEGPMPLHGEALRTVPRAISSTAPDEPTSEKASIYFEGKRESSQSAMLSAVLTAREIEKESSAVSSFERQPNGAELESCRHDVCPREGENGSKAASSIQNSIEDQSLVIANSKSPEKLAAATTCLESWASENKAVGNKGVEGREDHEYDNTSLCREVLHAVLVNSPDDSTGMFDRSLEEEYKALKTPMAEITAKNPSPSINNERDDYLFLETKQTSSSEADTFAVVGKDDGFEPKAIAPEGKSGEAADARGSPFSGNLFAAKNASISTNTADKDDYLFVEPKQASSSAENATTKADTFADIDKNVALEPKPITPEGKSVEAVDDESGAPLSGNLFTCSTPTKKSGKSKSRKTCKSSSSKSRSKSKGETLDFLSLSEQRKDDSALLTGLLSKERKSSKRDLSNRTEDDILSDRSKKSACRLEPPPVTPRMEPQETGRRSFDAPSAASLENSIEEAGTEFKCQEEEEEEEEHSGAEDKKGCSALMLGLPGLMMQLQLRNDPTVSFPVEAEEPSRAGRGSSESEEDAHSTMSGYIYGSSEEVHPSHDSNYTYLIISDGPTETEAVLSPRSTMLTSRSITAPRLSYSQTSSIAHSRSSTDAPSGTEDSERVDTTEVEATSSSNTYSSDSRLDP